MAAVGSAVGLGNMWRFPYRTASGGGAAFVLLYLGMTFLIGVPMMMAEFAVGRRTKLSSLGALRAIGGKRWLPLGYLFVLTSLLILSYLSVITGWTIRYAVDGLVSGFHADPGARYAAVSTGLPAITFHVITMIVTTGIVVMGVKGGIERVSLVLMPLLFATLIALAIWASTLDGGGPGYQFYLAPSLNALTDLSTIQGAASQAFFSLSVGMGIMLTYGSYLTGGENLGREAVIVSMADFSVAFVAGLVVFPVIFSLGLSDQVTESTMGALFISLPSAFVRMGAMGRAVGVAFFLMLTVASITSTVSLLEVVGSVAIDELGLSRRAATILAGLAATIIGIAAALSSGVLGFLDKVAGELFVIIGVLGMAVLVGHRMKAPDEEISAGSRAGGPTRLARGAVMTIRYFIPPLLALLAIVALLDTIRAYTR
jgi:neurotransmitter:Na+ symporter, NSS family